MLSNGRAASESDEVLVQRVLHLLLPPPPREVSLRPARWIELAELELHDEGELRHRQRGPERLLPSPHLGRLMNINPRGALRPLAINANPIRIRRRTPLPIIVYAVYLLYSNISLRYTAKSLRNIIVRSYTSIWR